MVVARSETVTSAATQAIVNVNDAPTGSVAVTGTATQAQTLTAANTLADADGLGALSYQWKAGGVNIDGATSSTYTLTQAEVGKTVTASVSYTDGGGTLETVTSAATQAVNNVNDAPTGSVTVSGTAAQAQTLTAANTLADADGLGTLSYQWKAGGANIDGATSSTYTLTQAEVGKTVTASVSYTDGGGTLETVTSAATQAINPPPAFDIELLSTSSGVATFEVYATTAADTGTPGLGSFQFELSHNVADMTIDATSFVSASGLLAQPNLNPSAGTLDYGGIALPAYTALSTPLLTFDATVHNTDNSFNILLDEVSSDGTDRAKYIGAI